MVSSTPAFITQLTSIGGLGNSSLEYLAYGSVTVPLTSGTGTIVVAGLAVIDQIVNVHQDLQSSVTYNNTSFKIDPSTKNQIDVTSLLVTVSTGGWAVDGGTSELMYYAVIGH